jgi:hypothetical protein
MNRISILILKIDKNYPATETPIHFPIPKVIEAAKSPKITILNPEYKTLFPVKSVMTEPMKNNPITLAPALM